LICDNTNLSKAKQEQKAKAICSCFAFCYGTAEESRGATPHRAADWAKYKLPRSFKTQARQGAPSEGATA